MARSKKTESVVEEKVELTEEEQAEEARKEYIAEMMKAISKFSNSPEESQVLAWKETFGDIYGFGLAEDELFLFRPLSRMEHREIMEKLRAAAQAAQEGSDASLPDEAEMVVDACILWCSKPASLHQKGGTMDTLYNQVLNCSNFVDPNIAAQLVFKL